MRATSEEAGIATSGIGTSVLGLDQASRHPGARSTSPPGGSGTEAFDLSYLYDESSRRSVNWRAISALVLVLFFAGFLAYIWRQYPSWHSMIIKPPQQQTKPVAKDNAGAAASDHPSAAPSGHPSATDSQNSAGPSPKDSAAPNTAIRTDGSTPDDQKVDRGEAAALPQNSGPDLNKNMKTSDAGSGNSANRPDVSPSGDPHRLASKEAFQKPPVDRSGADSAVNREPSNAAETQTTASAVDPAEDQYRLAMKYLEGRGEPQSCNHAVSLLNSAAAKGNSKAASQLGAMYATGHCVSFDRPTAYRWFSSALAEHHNPLTERNRQMLWSQMSESERQRALAMR